MNTAKGNEMTKKTGSELAVGDVVVMRDEELTITADRNRRPYGPESREFAARSSVTQVRGAHTSGMTTLVAFASKTYDVR